MAELIIALVAPFGVVVGATMLVIAENGDATNIEDGDDAVYLLDEHTAQHNPADPTAN